MKRTRVMEDEMTKPIAVLAGTFDQFNQYKKEHPGKDLRYCDGFQSVVGMRFSDAVVVGTFWDRQDATGIAEDVSTRLDVES